jgi:uncharacterized protein (DUF1015 family)
MPDISALRGIRYDLGRVGSLSNVIAPPYDVIDAELQQKLYDKHAANVVRLILNKDEPGDDDHNNRYTRAARQFRTWLRDGTLFTEADPAIYVYHQVFKEGGVEHTRRGFMSRCRLQRFGEGNIYPHEETHGAAKADRLKLWGACKANLSQIFSLFPDDTNEVQNILESAIAGVAPLEATDHLGVTHRIWPVTDVPTITAVVAAMGDRPVYIADGHHRYETACNLRDQIAKESGNLSAEHPANYVLMMFVSMSDPGMLVLATHRLFRGLPPMTAAQLCERLGDSFTTEPVGTGPNRARSLWEEIETEGDQGTLGLYTAADQQWTLVRLTDAGRQRMAEAASEHSDDWQGLGVSILHRLIMETLLAPSASLPAPKYVRDIEEVVQGLKEGDAAGRDATGQAGTGGRFELAALVMPATVDHIRAISSHGERMPAKSTFFYPKLLSGLVINPLE